MGVIVRDMDKAIEHYSSLGIGPFESLKKLLPIEKKGLGKPIDPDNFRLKVRVTQMGPVQLELIQPVAGESLWKEFLETKGEGINHLGFFVDDLDKEVAKLVEKGFKVIHGEKFLGGGGYAYLDTGKVGGVLLELIQWPSQ